MEKGKGRTVWRDFSELIREAASDSLSGPTGPKSTRTELWMRTGGRRRSACFEWTEAKIAHHGAGAGPLHDSILSSPHKHPWHNHNPQAGHSRPTAAGGLRGSSVDESLGEGKSMDLGVYFQVRGEVN